MRSVRDMDPNHGGSAPDNSRDYDIPDIVKELNWSSKETKLDKFEWWFAGVAFVMVLCFVLGTIWPTIKMFGFLALAAGCLMLGFKVVRWLLCRYGSFRGRYRRK